MHKYKDRTWQKAHYEYSHMKDMGLDKEWDPRWQQVKRQYEAADTAFKMAKRADPTWLKYNYEYKRIEDEAVERFFPTQEMKAIKWEFE